MRGRNVPFLDLEEEEASLLAWRKGIEVSPLSTSEKPAGIRHIHLRRSIHDGARRRQEAGKENERRGSFLSWGMLEKSGFVDNTPSLYSPICSRNAGSSTTWAAVLFLSARFLAPLFPCWEN